MELSRCSNDCSLIGHHDVSVAIGFVSGIKGHYWHPLAVDRFESSSFGDFKVHAEVRRWRERERIVDGNWGSSEGRGRGHVSCELARLME
jgi:hypothetical protein